MNINNQKPQAIKDLFRDTLIYKCGVKADERVLVAVSGGADSVALLHLFISAKFDCVVAHCNFSLRGEESDGDEAFVRNLCNNFNVPLRVIKFDTIEYASHNKLSIEMAARELRYKWFEELLTHENLTLLAIGHHGNDAMETFFLNLARGTGLKGLTGISWRRDYIIRPLLFARSSDIVSYCQANGLAFRTDSTNSDTKILRNKIRHMIIPSFLEINPSFFQTMQSNMELIKEVYDMFSAEAERFKEQFVVEDDGTVLIPVSVVKDHPQRKSLLFEVLRNYGFNGPVIDEIVRGLDGIPGRQYFSGSYRMVRDRYNLILVRRDPDINDRFYIQSGELLVRDPLSLKIKLFNRTPDFRFSTNNTVAHFDADLIDFPLEIRHWYKGDQFQPLGMKKFKKLSDFFIDEKYSLISKEQSWLLISNDDIVWIIGKRLDNRYKVTEKTTKVLEVAIV